MMDILATYPNNYSMDDYREYMKEECNFEGVKFKESMVTDDGFYSYCETQQEFDADSFSEELACELNKTKIKQGFLEIHNGGWRHQHGMTPLFDINTSSVLDKLLDSGEATIEMYKVGHKLGFMRYSHDEPMGADITLHSGRDFDRVENEVFA
jgi:hypothetical protein